MAKYQAKTTETNNDVTAFLQTIAPERLPDALDIIKAMQKQSGFKPKMWGTAIIGFGSYHYKYASGHEGDAPLVGFSPRKAEFALYLTADFENKEELLKNFGKYKIAKACIYIKTTIGINMEVFRKMITNSIKSVKERYKD